MRARSFFPLALIPQWMPDARIPGTAVMPPSSHSRAAIRGTPEALPAPRARPPPKQQVGFPPPVGRPPLAEFVRGQRAPRALRPRRGHAPDGAEVRARGDA